MQTETISYKRHHFPPRVIAHVVWLQARFNLSEAEELMLARGVRSTNTALFLRIILESRRDKRAAKRVLRPCRAVDKLRSYGAAKRNVAPGFDHWSHKGLNNRAETTICHFENESEHFRASGHRAACSISSPCSPQPAIVSLSQPADAPCSPFATIGSKLSRRGNQRRISLDQRSVCQLATSAN
jgi:putative transposase